MPQHNNTQQQTHECRGKTKLIIMAMLTVISFLLSQPLMAQNTTAPKESTPTLKETQDWLKEKLNAYASFTEVIANRDTVQKVDLVTFNECTLTYRYAHRSSSVGLELLQNYTCSLGDLDSSNAKIESKNGHYTLMLFAV